MLFAFITIAFSALFFVLKAHLQKEYQAQKVYLGAIFTNDLDLEKQEGGSRVVNPLLYVIRSLIIFLCLLIISSLFWPTPSPKGSLVVTDGPATISSNWPKPIYVVSAQDPHKNLKVIHRDVNESSTGIQTSTQDHIQGHWVKAKDLRPTLEHTNKTGLSLGSEIGSDLGSDHYKIRAPRLLGPQRLLDSLSDVFEKLNPQVFSHQRSKPININANATWKGAASKGSSKEASKDTEEYLEINAQINTGRITDGGITDGISRSLPQKFDLEVLKIHTSAELLAPTQHHAKYTSQWIKIGELQQKNNTGHYQWRSSQDLKTLAASLKKRGLWKQPTSNSHSANDLVNGLVHSLASRAIRIRSKGNHPIYIDYPLCIPMSSRQLGINDYASTGLERSSKHQQYKPKEYEQLRTFFKNLGFITHDQAQQQSSHPVKDLSDQQIWQIDELDAANLSQTKQINSTVNNASSSSLWHLYGDHYSHFNPQMAQDHVSPLNQSRLDLFGLKKTWAPLAKATRLRLFSPQAISPQGALALSLPKLPISTSIFTSYAPLNQGKGLLWLSQKEAQKNTLKTQTNHNDVVSPQVWQSSHLIVSHELSAEGQRLINFGVDLHDLLTQSPLWLASILKTFAHVEAQSRSKCYEWPEGEVLSAYLPIRSPQELKLSFIQDDGVLAPVNIENDIQNRINVTAEKEGVYYLNLPNSVENSSGGQTKRSHIHRPNELLLVRQKKALNRLLLDQDLLNQQAAALKSSKSPKTQDKDTQAAYLLNLERLELTWNKRLQRHWHALSEFQKKSIYLCLFLVAISLLAYLYFQRLILFKIILSVAALGIMILGILEYSLSEISLNQLNTFKLVPFAQILPQSLSDQSESPDQSKPKLSQLNQLSFIDEQWAQRHTEDSRNNETDTDFTSFQHDWARFKQQAIRPEFKTILSSWTEDLRQKWPILATLSKVYQSQDHQERFIRYEGAKWIKPSLMASDLMASGLMTSNNHSKRPLRLSQYQVHRDEARQEILLKVLIESSDQFKNSWGELYLNEAKTKFQLSPPGKLISLRVKDRSQKVIKLKLEYHQEALNQTQADYSYEYELPIVLPRIKRKTFWTWGTELYQQLSKLGLVLAQGVNTQVFDALPNDLFGIALHKVDPKFLSLDSIEQLYDWVSQGGLLIWSGNLSQAQKEHYRQLEKNQLFRALTPLSHKKKIPQNREAQLVFIVDRSGSTDTLAGGPGLANITAKLSSLIAQLAPKDEVTLISFGGGTELTLAPTSRNELSQFPVPHLSRGGTVLHPALELALSYRRPSLEAHWVIVSDGEWGDDSERLLGNLAQRLKASDVNLSIAHFEHAGQSICKGLCQSFAQAVNAQVLDWNDLDIEQLQGSLRETKEQNKQQKLIKLTSTKLWDKNVGGLLKPVQSFTPMSLRQSAKALAFADGFPIFAEKKLGLGRVVQFMSDDFTLAKSQWQRLLNLNQGDQPWWSIKLQPQAHPLLGKVNTLVAFSDQKPPRGSSTLSSTAQSSNLGLVKAHWLPTGQHTSVLASCDHPSQTPSWDPLVNQCQAITLSNQEPELYTVQFTSNKQLHTVDLIAPDLTLAQIASNTELAEHELAMYWNQKLEQADAHNFKQAYASQRFTKNKTTQRIELTEPTKASATFNLESSHRLIPSLHELQKLLQHKDQQLSTALGKIPLSFYIGILCLLVLLSTLVETYLWRRAKST